MLLDFGVKICFHVEVIIIRYLICSLYRKFEYFLKILLRLSSGPRVNEFVIMGYHRDYRFAKIYQCTRKNISVFIAQPLWGQISPFPVKWCLHYSAARDSHVTAKSHVGSYMTIFWVHLHFSDPMHSVKSHVRLPAGHRWRPKLKIAWFWEKCMFCMHFCDRQTKTRTTPT